MGNALFSMYTMSVNEKLVPGRAVNAAIKTKKLGTFRSVTNRTITR